jgi:hypothetical protein
VRLIQGYEGEHAPPKQEEEIMSIPKGSGKGRFQCARPGSYAVDSVGVSAGDIGLEASFYTQSYLLKSGHVQTLISTLDVSSKSGFAIIIDESGR